jgi:RND family efflux transporter MFP subunit
VLRVGNVSRVKGVFFVPEGLRQAFTPQREITFGADVFPGKTWAGRVLSVSGQADGQTRTFRVEVEASNPGAILLPNMVARLSLPAQKSQAIATVPVSAVGASGRETFVYVLERNQARKRIVRLGAPTGNSVVVLSGLRVGEQIAATPQRLTDNAPVRVAVSRSL